MFSTGIEIFIKGLLKAWERNIGAHRSIITIALSFGFVSIVGAIVFDLLKFPKEYQYGAFSVAIISGSILAVIVAKEELVEQEIEKQKIEEVEELVRVNPDKPEYAWDLARRKLESFLDRNLNQVKSIFWLTSFVMLCGFGLVLYGVVKAYSEPSSLSTSIVSAGSGIILSFIGGSFLLIFRSTMSQSASYVTVLERINAVGMVVQIASTIPDSEEKIRVETTAALAKALLAMYSIAPPKITKK